MNLKLPSNTTEVQSFLDLIACCGKFIPDFATIIENVKSLIHQNIDFRWNEKKESAFSKIKFFISRSSFVVISSSYRNQNRCWHQLARFGGWFTLQRKPENVVFLPIAFANISYSQTKREALALIFTFERIEN